MKDREEWTADEMDLNDLFDERKEKGDNEQPRKEERPFFSRQPQNNKPMKILSAVFGSILIAGVAFSTGVLASRAAMDEEMRSIIHLKQAIQQYYYKEITDEEFYKVVFDGIEKGLLDQYSDYLTSDEMQERITEAEGEYIGIGISFFSTAIDENGLYINKVSGNSPAERVGMEDGAYLVGYGATEGEIVKMTSMDDFEDFLADYGANEPFYIQFKNPLETQATTVSISRQEYVENYIYYRAKSSAYSFTGEDALSITATDDFCAALPENAAYIELVQFNGNADKQFKMAMDKFKEEGKKDLILDLRGNGGGYVDILRSIAAYFTKSTDESTPVVAVAKYRDGSVENFKAKGNLYDEYFQTDSNVYVLADDNSASASECLLGAMLDYEATTYANLCLIEKDGVAKTYGKGIMQTTLYLSYLTRDAVTLTTATVEWPKGKCIHGVGVTKADGTKSVADDKSEETELLLALSAWGLNG